MKHLISSFFVLMSVCMFSCSDNNSDEPKEPDIDQKESIVGHWQQVLYKGDIPLGIGFTFNSDGTGYGEAAQYDDEKDDGTVIYSEGEFTYSINGNIITLKNGDKISSDKFSLQKNSLIIYVHEEETGVVFNLTRTDKSFGETFGYK